MEDSMDDMDNLGFTQRCMIDLHGYSVQRSRESINRQIEMASQTNIRSFRFVTGRGNHINSKGERGTLYRELPNWLSAENISKIASVKKGEGYYEIDIKPTTPKKIPHLIGEQITQQCLSTNIATIKMSAEHGDIDAQYLLGHCCQYGIGCEINYPAAIKWYRKSVNGNNPLAQYALGSCYWQGVGVKQDDKTAIELFKKAAEQDVVWVVEQLGDIYSNGYGVKADSLQAKNYYQKAANLGSLTAKRKLAHIYYYDTASPQDKKIAVTFYKELADKGDAHAAYNVACAYYYGNVVQKDPKLAFFYAKQAADDNDPDAQYLLYLLYSRGFGTERDAAQGFLYLKRAADNHFKHALYELAVHPSTTVRGERLSYIIKAAKAGQINAQAFLLSIPSLASFSALLPESERTTISQNFWKQADIEALTIPNEKLKYEVMDVYLKYPNVTKKQKAKILRLLTALAAQNEPMAYRRLGGLYYYAEGNVVIKDVNKAEHYWLKGAKLNDAHCLCALGYCYEDKAKLDALYYQKAFDYHKKAMELGNANSCVQIGFLYQCGHGVQKDIPKAVKYFHDAIKLDEEPISIKQRDTLFYKPILPYAAYNLACIYGHGDENFPMDFEKATHWFVISAKAGNRDAENALSQVGLSHLMAENDYLPKEHAVKIEANVGFWKPSAEGISSKASNPLPLLKEFAECLKLEVNWKMSQKDIAWSYIATKELSRLKGYMLKPFTFEKTKDDRHIILLKNVSNTDLLVVINEIKIQLMSGFKGISGPKI